MWRWWSRLSKKGRAAIATNPHPTRQGTLNLPRWQVLTSPSPQLSTQYCHSNHQSFYGRYPRQSPARWPATRSHS
jgi:hypothetical protein